MPSNWIFVCQMQSNVLWSCSIFKTSLQVQFNDYRPGNNVDSFGFLEIASLKQLAMFAWASTYDLFNTAVFSNREVSASFRSAVVHSWGATAADRVEELSPDACTAPLGLGAFDLDTNACRMTVRPTHNNPAKAVPIQVAIGSGLSAKVGTIVVQ